MPRQLKPISAAKRILDMIERGEAKNIDEAILKDARLAPGEALLKEAVKPSEQPSQAPVPAATGSGSARLSR